MKKNTPHLLLILTIAMLAMSACGNSSSPSPSGSFPTGDFKAVNPLYADEIRFLEDSSYQVHFVWEGTWYDPYEGTYSITGDQLVFDDPDTECAGHPGTYTWSFDGTTLTLKVIEDTCTALPRAQDLGRAWTKVP